MSRIRVFGLNGKSLGEFSGRLSRGWAILGSADVRGGGQSTVEISQDTAAKGFLELGRTVLIEDEQLPPWTGVIDPDWNAYGKPSLTIYNIEYLLSLRMPDDVITISAPTGEIVKRLLLMANDQENTRVLPGELDHDNPHEVTLDRRSIWEQVQEVVTNAGMELTFRPEIVSGQLTVYVDLDKRAGRNTNFLYHDGTNANMAVTGASITGEIANRVIGINDAYSEEERLTTEAITDPTSILLYRLRSKVVQFSGVNDRSDLEAKTREYLAQYSRPRLQMTVSILDQGEAFARARLGNQAIFHASDVRLPGGVHGWRGAARIMAMAYDEPSRTLGATIIANL